MRYIVVLAVALVVVSLAAACGSAAPPTPAPAASTVGQVAEAGGTVFGRVCARCHGRNGEGLIGPAIIGPNANLHKFGTAGGLLDLMTVAMPFDAPGSLSRQEYIQGWSYLLVQNGFVAKDTAFDEVQLRDVALQ